MSGTMVCANKVGISLFVTGGLGGVHRDGEKCMENVYHTRFLISYTMYM